jgi:hypothetical protein
MSRPLPVDCCGGCRLIVVFFASRLVFVSSQQRPHVFNTSTIVFWPERWSIMFVGKWEGPRHLWLVRAAVRAMAAVTRHRCQRHRRGCLPLIVGAVVFVLLLLLMILSSLCLLLLLLSELIYVYVRSQQRRELFQTATVVFRRQRWSTMVIGRGAWGGRGGGGCARSNAAANLHSCWWSSLNRWARETRLLLIGAMFYFIEAVCFVIFSQ